MASSADKNNKRDQGKQQAGSDLQTGNIKGVRAQQLLPGSSGAAPSETRRQGSDVRQKNKKHIDQTVRTCLLIFQLSQMYCLVAGFREVLVVTNPILDIIQSLSFKQDAE